MFSTDDVFFFFFFFSFLLRFGRRYLPFTPQSREYRIQRQTSKFPNFFAREKRQFTLIWKKKEEKKNGMLSRYIKKKKDSPAFVCIGLTRKGQIYGQYPLRQKIRDDKGAANARTRAHGARKCVSGMRTEYRDRYRKAGNHGVICRPAHFRRSMHLWSLVTLSSRARFPPCVYPRRTRSLALRWRKFNFPYFSMEKKARCFSSGT